MTPYNKNIISWQVKLLYTFRIYREAAVVGKAGKLPRTPNL